MKFAEFSLCKHCVKGVQMRSFCWSAFSRVRTENGDLHRKSLHSLRIREHTDKKTPHFETFLITRSIQLKLLLKLLSTTTANLIN